MTLIEMSFTGAVLVGVTVIVRAVVLHRLPKGTLLLLWWLALARFLLPFSVPSPFSAYALLREETAAVSRTETAAFVPSVQPMPQTEALTVSEDTTEKSGIPVLPLVWAAGSIGCALFFAAASLRCKREFRSSLPVAQGAADEWLAAHPLKRKVQLRCSDRISAPLTYGILRPVILVPEGFDFQNAGLTGYVLAHEWVHIRRFDGLTKLLVITAACLHWWNPMAWVLYVLFNRDLELSCDEAVVRQSVTGSRADYARALIRMEEYKSGLAPFCSSFNRNAMEERILAIMKMKNWSRRTAAASAATVFAVGLLFATSAQAANTSRNAESSALTNSGSNTAVPEYAYPVSSVDWNEERELLESFEPFGISYDSDGKMYFKGERVRWFWDGYDIWEEDGRLIGWSIRYEYLDKDGTVDVRTLHARKDNGDGSWDGYGELTDIIPYSQEEFDSRTYEDIRKHSEETFTEEDAVLVEEPAHPGTADSNIAYAAEDNTPVSEAPAPGTADSNIAFAVEDSFAFSEVTGVYTGGTAEVSEDAVIGGAEATTVNMTSSRDIARGRTFKEIFAEYKPYGITYQENDGHREVYYNGELVAKFADINPDGGTFTFSSISDKLSTLTVHTVYDKNGKLTGVAPVGESASYAPYAKYGLSANASGKLLYEDRLVRCFDDSVPKTGGGTKAIGYYNENGTVDIRAVRNKKGELTGLEKASYQEFHAREIHTPAKAGTKPAQNDGMAMFAPYQEFGLTVKDSALYYDGQRVRQFLDANNRRQVSNWDELGTVDVYAVRASGSLTSLRLATGEEFKTNTAQMENQALQAEYAG